MPAEYKKPLDQGRLLLLSPLDERIDRVTLETASFRNRFVAAIADAIFVAHAEPEGKTEQFCREVLGWKKPLYTLDAVLNANLLTIGAKPLRSDEVPSLSALFKKCGTDLFPVREKTGAPPCAPATD